MFVFVILAVSNYVFLGFFFLEMCTRMYALGPTLYFASKFNKFDFMVSNRSFFN